ncbi:hypothetical protein ONZ43_g1615 [Nemania bipapillata]|uniref:Uncharacterized protein n=1 Tax=Nemania bipapillata TaxID=110536 RepID=A0ACC2J3N9_9PEZI|nr:hypothetical protein ONZ43_g1615 [Nemania bipapillata]
MDPENAANANKSQTPNRFALKPLLRKHVEPATRAPMKLAKVAVAWATKMPDDLNLNRGKHPEWPGYTGEGKKLHFKLRMRQYESQTLVENTILSFYPTEDDRNLTPIQISAREDIVKLFKWDRDKTKPITGRDMRSFLRLFDEFFFFGSMTNRHHPRVVSMMWEKESRYAHRVAPCLFKEVGVWGVTQDRYFRGYGHIQAIHLAGSSFFPPDYNKLSFFIETLVHEMVHAYLNLHACRCQTCEWDILNTTGLTGHGPAFLMMLDSIHYTLKSWRAGLSAVQQRTFPNGSLISMYDEIKLLRYRESQAFMQRMEAYAKNLTQYLVEGQSSRQQEARACELTAAEVRKKGTKKGTRKGKNKKWEKTENQKDKRQWIDEENEVFLYLNGMKPLSKRPGMNVYMTSAVVGATKVDQAKLDETCNTVQALLKRREARRLRWPKSIFRSKKSNEQVEPVGMTADEHGTKKKKAEENEAREHGEFGDYFDFDGDDDFNEDDDHDDTTLRITITTAS